MCYGWIVSMDECVWQGEEIWFYGDGLFDSAGVDCLV